MLEDRGKIAICFLPSFSGVIKHYARSMGVMRLGIAFICLLSPNSPIPLDTEQHRLNIFDW